jgi:hypothetical protein
VQGSRDKDADFITVFGEQNFNSMFAESVGTVELKSPKLAVHQSRVPFFSSE